MSMAARSAAPSSSSLAKLTQGKGGDKAETVLLLIELLDDPYIWARREAIRALGEIGGADALAPLARSAAVEGDSRVRQAARAALRKIRERESGAKGVEELSAEVQRLREDLRYQSGRLEELEKRAP